MFDRNLVAAVGDSVLTAMSSRESRRLIGEYKMTERRDKAVYFQLMGKSFHAATVDVLLLHSFALSSMMANA